MEIIEVLPESPLFGYVHKGDRLVGIDGKPVEDRLDCRYKLSEERVVLEFQTKSGKRHSFEIENDYEIDIGLRFARDKIKPCRNKCIFCFVHQQPKGMRRPLYFRDDDFRLSFTHGNFITLSNLKPGDVTRIVEQRLSPLYVSVHTTDDELRRYMFGNRRLEPIIPALKKLTEHGITVHTQVVVCPEINDSEQLRKTIDDLHSLYPGVDSVGVVPVGLTRYRGHLPALIPFDGNRADGVLKIIHEKQREFYKESGARFVFGADEFYIMAGKKLPRLSEYEDMPQFENGIGMMRLLLSDFNRRRRFLERDSGNRRICFLTGTLAAEILEKEVAGWLRKNRNFKLDIIPVENKFWGERITVSGLLTGKDLMEKAKAIQNNYDAIFLPPNCLNDDNLFLDDVTLERFRKAVKARVTVGSYSVIDTLRGMDR